MTIVTIDNAKTNLSKLITRAEAGEEILLARDSQPVARIVPLRSWSAKRIFGALRGIVSVGPEFFEPLPAAEVAGWRKDAS